MREGEASYGAVDDPFDLAALDAALSGTLFWGKLNYFSTIESTNTTAMLAGASGAAAGNVYFADEQTAGRGRGGHTWHSAAGSGLYVSVLLRPRVSAADAQWFPLAAGLAVRDAVARVTGLQADIRWPNDLLLGGRKFCGILAELHADGSRVGHVAVGIGINVHQAQFPAELSALATSLRIESRREWARQELLIELLRALRRETAVLSGAGDGPGYLADVKRRMVVRLEAASTWIRGKRVVVGDGPGSFGGITAGLDERGFLLMETAEGMRTVLSGGVREPAQS